MQRFTELYRALDETNATSAKVRAMTEYFAAVPAEDAAWAVYFLTGRRLRRLAAPGELRQWTLKLTGMPEWLLEETYASVGDLAETLSLLLDNVLPPPPRAHGALHVWVEQRLQTLRGRDADYRRDTLHHWWAELPTESRFVLNKMLTGAFRVGVSRRLVVRALAQASGVEPARLAHRLMGQWQPDAQFFRHLVDHEDHGEDASRPYPFFLASPLAEGPEVLGPRQDWLAEWKWDGVRGQLLRRDGHCFIWSRGEELMEGRFPEIEAAASTLPEGTVLDGEILAWQDQRPLPFNVLQQRINRLKPSARMQQKAPVIFLAYDLLEQACVDLRRQPLSERRQRLHQLLDRRCDAIQLSRPLAEDSWQTLSEQRERALSMGTEGLMLKRLESPYRVGRARGDWWKWKVAPRTIDAVLLYAQPGHGRRSNLFTDYTFGIRDGEGLVPIAKAYSGLDNSEIERLDRWIRRHTTERFGPVRAVEAMQVFELAFEGIAPSPRHKSGIALRFPRITRWRQDLAPRDADSLDDVRALLEQIRSAG